MKTLFLLALSLLLLGTLVACNKPLFPENTPRSQYERYSDLRGRSTPATETGPYGREAPALRERLRPME